GVLSDVGAADRNGDDLRAAGVDGGTGFGEIAVLAGADQQPGVEALSADNQRIRIFNGIHGEVLVNGFECWIVGAASAGGNVPRRGIQPPPTAATISRRSPSCNVQRPYWLRGT